MSVFFDDSDVLASDPVPFNSDVIVEGDTNSPPLVSDNPETTTESPFSGALKILGSIGQNARDLGTAVGQTQRDLKQAGRNYQDARTAAASGNKLQTWWLYASDTDKIMVVLATAGVAFAAYSAFKGK